MIIPANVTDLKSKLKGAFSKKPSDKILDNKKEDDTLSRRTLSKIAEEKAKRRALADELADEKTTATRREEIIAGLTAQNEALQTELEEHKAKVEDLTPKAKAWSDHKHKEMTKITEMFPPEDRKDAKAMGEKMDDVDLYRKYAARVTGKPLGEQQQSKTGKEKDWNAVMNGDAAEAEKAIAADPAGFNKFMEERK